MSSHSVDGEDNERFKRKPTMSPMSPTKIAKVKEKPGSPFRNLRLFSISCGEKKKKPENVSW